MMDNVMRATRAPYGHPVIDPIVQRMAGHRHTLPTLLRNPPAAHLRGNWSAHLHLHNIVGHSGHFGRLGMTW